MSYRREIRKTEHTHTKVEEKDGEKDANAQIFAWKKKIALKKILFSVILICFFPFCLQLEQIYPDPIRVVFIGQKVDYLLGDTQNKEWISISTDSTRHSWKTRTRQIWTPQITRGTVLTENTYPSSDIFADKHFILERR